LNYAVISVVLSYHLKAGLYYIINDELTVICHGHLQGSAGWYF